MHVEARANRPAAEEANRGSGSSSIIISRGGAIYGAHRGPHNDGHLKVGRTAEIVGVDEKIRCGWPSGGVGRGRRGLFALRRQQLRDDAAYDGVDGVGKRQRLRPAFAVDPQPHLHLPLWDRGIRGRRAGERARLQRGAHRANVLARRVSKRLQRSHASRGDVILRSRGGGDGKRGVVGGGGDEAIPKNSAGDAAGLVVVGPERHIVADN